jgi:hypothetical protein
MVKPMRPLTNCSDRLPSLVGRILQFAWLVDLAILTLNLCRHWRLSHLHECRQEVRLVLPQEGIGVMNFPIGSMTSPARSVFGVVAIPSMMRKSSSNRLCRESNRRDASWSPLMGEVAEG